MELLMALPTAATVVETPVVPSVPEVSVVRLRKERTPHLPDNLPVVEEVIEPEPVKAQPEAWRCIGQETSEQLDYEPTRFLRRRTIRKKYVSRTDADAAPMLAALPERLLDRSLPAPGLIAAILVGKYCDHLPLYRQEQIFLQCHQVHLPRQTLARWVALAADWLQPIYENIRTEVMAGGYVQVDETPIDYLEPGNGKSKQGYLWTGHRPGGDVFYRWETSRAAACLDLMTPPNLQMVPPKIVYLFASRPVTNRLSSGSTAISSKDILSTPTLIWPVVEVARVRKNRRLPLASNLARASAEGMDVSEGSPSECYWWCRRVKVSSRPPASPAKLRRPDST